MKILWQSLVTIATLGLAAGAFAAGDPCGSYIKKVSIQLDACGKSLACLEAPFKHAMNLQNYATTYQSCKGAFDGEISRRLSQAQANPHYWQGPASAVVAKPELLPTGIVAGPSCTNAESFLKYATQSCRTIKCIDQQFANTMKIPAFKLCGSNMIGFRDSQKSLIAKDQASYYYTYPQSQNAKGSFAH